MLNLVPIRYRDAKAFIAKHHRHHVPPQGWLFGIGLSNGSELIGVATVGRPVSRHRDDGLTAEVTRCCTDGTRNACSKLYGACWRAVRAMGYRRLITYTLPSEGGTSLRASGWCVIGETRGGSWDRPSRPREDKHPLGQKWLWEQRDSTS